MFREMRRKKQALRPEDCARILAQGTSGVLALLGDDGYPYAVPLSYVYHEGRVYFHSAMAGHKLDALRRCPKASFCVAADLLAMKYAPADSNENRAEVIRQEWPRFCMLELSVEHLTGKEAIELMRERRETP